MEDSVLFSAAHFLLCSATGTHFFFVLIFYCCPQLPSGLPPLFPPDLKTDLEKYLLDPTSLPIHDFHKTQRYLNCS